MSTSQPKSVAVSAHQVVLYRRPLHPELFPLRARHTTAGGPFEVEFWLTPGGHVLRAQVARFCLSELLTDQQGNLPAEGAITMLPCAGNEFEHSFDKEQVRYGRAVQTENLALNLYLSTYDERVEYAKEVDGLVHAWTGEDGGRCLSIAEVGIYDNAVHVQTYHLQSVGGVVVRSQTLIEPIR